MPDPSLTLIDLISKMETAIIISLFIAILWGVVPVIHRYVLPNVSSAFVMMISAAVYAVSVGIYISIFHWKNVKEDMIKNAGLIPILAATTFFGLFIANILYLHVLRHANNVNIVTVLSSLYPVITVLLAAVVLEEHLTMWGLIGFFIVVLGVGIMMYSGNNKRQKAP